jgi:hypothetical protein
MEDETIHDAEAGQPRRNYLVRHWRGELSLPVSYWINGTLIAGVGVALLGAGLGALEATGLSLSTLSMLVLVFLALSGLVWLWSMVGIWRSAGRHPDRGGNVFWTGAARIRVALAVLGATGRVYGYLLQTREYAQLASGRDPMGPPAELRTEASGETLTLVGAITVGTGDRFERSLSQAPRVKLVRLSSPGGRILEAQRIAAAIRRRKLDTRVDDLCASACTFVLLAGANRTANEDARIGFHQPSFPGLTPEQNAGAIEAMRSAYRRAGIEDGFVRRAMTTPAVSIWYPDMREMIDAHVITDTEIVISSSKSRMKTNVAQELVAAARAVNTRGPVTVDPFTTLTGADASGTTMTYRYRVKLDGRRLTSHRIRAGLTPVLKRDVCGNPDMRLIVEAGGAFRYVYSGSGGRELAAIVIRSCR